LMRAMFKPHTAGEVFNLGNTAEHTVLEYAQTIIRLCEATSEIIYEPNRVDDPERRRPDISKAQRVLGWQPTVSVETGLRHTIEWFSNYVSQPSSIK
jgi:nucleoside-diphosphate-sugar epimerase